MKLALKEHGHPRNGRRNPPLNVAPIDLVDPPEEEDEQEDDNNVIQSDVVSDYANLICSCTSDNVTNTQTHHSNSSSLPRASCHSQGSFY